MAGIQVLNFVLPLLLYSNFVETSLLISQNDSPSIFSAVSFDCLTKLKRICGLNKESDELLFLECIQTFKPIEVSSIDDQCQHLIWKYVGDMGSDGNIQRLTQKACGKDLLDSLHCQDYQVLVMFILK